MNAAHYRRLQVIEALSRIQNYAQNGRSAFLGDTFMQDAILWNLQTVYLALPHLPEGVRSWAEEAFPATVGEQIADRSLEMQLEQVWEVVDELVPALRARLEEQGQQQ